MLSDASDDCFDADIELQMAQDVNENSRVILSNKTDKFGLQQIALDWRLTELDGHTMRVAALAMGRRMARDNIGRMQLFPWLLESPTLLPPKFKGGCHHMCTTRMSDDPKRGVVDSNCRVFGLENLYIGGSSVFTNSGLSNPTYTIVQLALRLGDHLNGRLERR
jgi:choline dehydrogenase-like flavoprotein